MTTTILIVDDHPLFRKGLHLIFEEEQDMRVVGEAGDGQEAIERVRELSPDVVVMDITMPNLNGMEATRRILMESPDTKIVALSIHAGKRFVKDMLSAGAAGYILKDSVPEELTNGIRKVMRGEVYLSSVITGVVVSEYVSLLSGDRKAEKEPASPHAASADSTIPILKTKLYQPPCTEEHVHRAHLIDKLDRNRYRPLTLVVAPAGYGKSTLVSCWLEACGIPCAWVSLDETDNDLRQFLSYLLAAVQNIFPGAGRETQFTTLNATDLPPTSVLAHSFINELDQIDQEFILTMDDYHVIQDKAVHNLLAEILHHPPRAMHLVLVSRRDPPLPLVSLRAKRQMTEIRVQDLRFSQEETAVFLQQMTGTSVDEATVAALEKRIEGWVTGLRLAALSLRHLGDLDRVVAQLPEDNRYVMDYVVTEVLSQQSSAIQEYLLTTSILNRFCQLLCDAVCVPDTSPGVPEMHGEEFVEWLEHTYLFVTPLDNAHHWFRYHPLFQKLLQHLLERKLSGNEIDTLHQRAGAWFAENDLVDEALYHLLIAGDYSAAVRLVIQHHEDVMDKEQWPRLRRWIDLLPQNIIEKEPELLIVVAYSLWNQMRISEMREVLDRIETLPGLKLLNSGRTRELQVKCDILRSIQYLVGEPFDHLSALSHAQQALQIIPRQQYRWRSTAIMALAISHQMAGDSNSAFSVVFEALKEQKVRKTIFHARLLIALCHIQLAEGDLKGLQQTAGQQLKIGRELDLPESIAYANVFLGVSYYLRNDLTSAEKNLDAVIRDIGKTSILNFSHSVFGLALTYQAQGRPDEALKTAKLLVSYSLDTSNPFLLQTAQAFQAELALRQGHISEVVKWAENYDTDPFRATFRFYVPQLTKVKILFAQETTESLQQTSELLSRLHDFFVHIHTTRFLIDVLALQALVDDARGEESDSFEKLMESLNLAEPGGFIRPFLDLGPKMANLLNRLAKEKPALKYAERILVAFSNEESGTGRDVSDDQSVQRSSLSNQALVEPLTNRELEVIDLLAQRMSNKEIAEKLFISPETVKRHTINIYQKLGVNSRREAVDKAHALGLLGES